ncbi:unnamed protein product, partial [Rhizoctonia solani]
MLRVKGSISDSMKRAEIISSMARFTLSAGEGGGGMSRESTLEFVVVPVGEMARSLLECSQGSSSVTALSGVIGRSSRSQQSMGILWSRSIDPTAGEFMLWLSNIT